MKVGLYSQCMGGNSQYEAIYRRPDLFENVLCMCSPMVVSMSAIYSAFSELQGVSQYQELIDLELLKMGAFTAAEMTPQRFAAGVKMPVLMIQVLEDEWTRNPEDAQKTFDLRVVPSCAHGDSWLGSDMRPNARIHRTAEAGEARRNGSGGWAGSASFLRPARSAGDVSTENAIHARLPTSPCGLEVLHYVSAVPDR